MKAWLEQAQEANALELKEAQQASKKELEAKDDKYREALLTKDKELEGYRDALAAKEEELKEDQSHDVGTQLVDTAQTAGKEEEEEQDKKEAKDKIHAAEAQLADTAQTGLGLDADGDASPGVRRHQQQHSLTPSAPSGAKRPVEEMREGDTVSADW